MTSPCCWATATAPSRTQVRYRGGGLCSDLAHLVTGDFNGDGRLDLAAANADSNDIVGAAGQRRRHLPGPGARTRWGLTPESLVAGDFNGDGRPDLAVANFSTPTTCRCCWATATAPSRPRCTYAAGWAEPTCLVAGDFNGDGRPDLAAANSGSNDVAGAAERRRYVRCPWPVRHHPHATPLVADLNGDGTDDVMVINAAGDILYRQGQPREPGTFDPPVKINPGFPARDIVAVDTNQGPVLASVDATDNAISLYAWRDGNFVRIGSLPTGRCRRRSSRPTSTATAGTTWWSATRATAPSRSSSTTAPGAMRPATPSSCPR